MKAQLIYDKLKSDRICKKDKNKFYKIEKSCKLSVIEDHESDGKETVILEYDLREGQYGIAGYEYRSRVVSKENCKTADILACVVDDQYRLVRSTILDIKSNISAFSDDLMKDGAMITAIKEVRDFIEQIHAEILHKKSFIHYIAEGYKETEQIGIATKSFEPEKFAAVAEVLEKMKVRPAAGELTLPEMKLKNILQPYFGESEKLKNFAVKKVIISEKEYDLNVFLLSETGKNEYETSIRV